MSAEVQIHEKLPLTKAIPLGLQHVFAMFGATVLVPFLTGLSPSVALLSSGIGTIIFLLMTKSLVPAYLGSSFAYIGVLTIFVQNGNTSGAMGGVIAVGLVYIILFLLMAAFGTRWIHTIVPPIVAGPVVAIIGLSLTPVAADMASANWYIAAFTLAVAAFLSVYAKGFLKIIPILVAIVVGYIVSAFMGIVDFKPILDALDAKESFFVFPVATGSDFIMPSWDKLAILAIAPLALVTIIEDLGHMIVLGNITHSDPIKNPGFHRVLLGNGLATGVAGLIGGPPVTTYGENIGVLAVTKVYSTFNLWIAAILAIIFSMINPLQAAIMSIPLAVMGGVCILLFGMIGATGLRTLIDAKIDFSETRNLIIASVIFALGIGLPHHGVAWATVIGIFLNLVLREQSDKSKPKLAK